MKSKKFAKFAAASLLGVSSAAICEIYRYAFCRNPGILERFEKKGHDGEYYLHRDSKAAELAARSFIRHSITSSRGDTLAGYYYMSGSRPSGKIAFIVHGFRSDHLDAAGMYYEYYLSRGIDVFLCDNAGTGESGGNHIGYDVYESEDCLKWLDFLKHEYGEDIRVLLHGFSMGGATVLRMSDVCPPQVRFIVSDSGYSSAADIMRRRVGIALYGFSALNYLLAGYKLSETDVRAHVAKSRVPILFVHGREDSTVPFSMGEELYNLCPGEKDCLWVDDARHVESMHRAPQAYEAKLDSFIKKYM